MDIAIITGASSGIGEHILRKIVTERGAYGSLPFEQIWIIARSEEKLQALKSELDPKRIRPFALDLTDPDALRALSEALQIETPNVGLLVNCAGVGYSGATESMEPAQFRNTVMLNCSALSEMVSICLPYMIPTGDRCPYAMGPRILNIASSAGFMPQPGFAAYAASKAFVISFSRALHAELRMHNISSTTVCPGPVATDFISHGNGADASFRGIKKFFVVRPERLADKSVAAARKGRAILVYGISQKIFHVASKILPTALLLFFAQRLSSDKPQRPSVASPEATLSTVPSSTVPDSVSAGTPTSDAAQNIIDTTSKSSPKRRNAKVSSADPTDVRPFATPNASTLQSTDQERVTAESGRVMPDHTSKSPSSNSPTPSENTSDPASLILSRYPGKGA